MKVSSIVLANGNIKFDNFVVMKEGNNFYGVYEGFRERQGKDNENKPITSGKTLQSACKKAKLLQIGYNLAKEDSRNCDYYGW